MQWHDKGSSQWHLPADILDNPVVPEVVQKTISSDSDLIPGLQWENIKLSLRLQFQEMTKFCCVQHDQELRSLWQTIRMINRRIYYGEQGLEKDLKVTQNAIYARELSIWERDKLDMSSWVEMEGTCKPDFLHLDLMHQQTAITKILDASRNLVEGDSVREVLHDFYAELYKCCDTLDNKEIENFLAGLADLPKISNATAMNIIGDVMEQEVFNAINKLKIGKAPGLDSLTADFYKKFAVMLALVLVDVFNEAFQNQQLPPSLSLAVIVLLYKKGLKQDAGNYRPILLTNVDYKILAYILTECLKPVLKDVIHPSQTAYLPGKFIGTNICKVQDAIDFAQDAEKEWVILFLDFHKAFDSVSHLFLMTMLRMMGFPPDYIAWILVLYSGASSMIRNNGWLSSKFHLGRV